MSNRIPIGSPIRTQAIINRYFVHAKKKLGQNFLIDEAAINGIIEAAQIKPGDQVIEIGPGIGSLTEQLLFQGAKVFAYEVDRNLLPILQNELPNKINGQPLSQSFKLVLKDILKANFKNDLANFFELTKPIKVVANLPYYITTPIIFFLAESDLHFSSLTLMMQKEVAQRLIAVPGNKTFGPLSIAVQIKMKADLTFQIDHNSFMPRPKVDSSVVVLTPLVNPIDVGDPKKFNQIVKMCFNQRRKTLNNNLKPLVTNENTREKLIADIGADLRVRPETLSISQFIQLAQFISKQ